MTEAIQAVFDESGNYVISGEAAERLSAILGHQPTPGEQVSLTLVGDDDLDRVYADDVDDWLNTVGKAAYNHAKAHPERAMNPDEARARLAERRALRLGAE